MSTCTTPIKRGTARRLGLRKPPKPMRLARISQIDDSGVGEYYAVAGVSNGRSWVEDARGRAVRPMVDITAGMVRDTRDWPAPWVKIAASKEAAK